MQNAIPMTNSNTNRKEAKGDKFSLRNGRPDLDFDLISDLPVDICNAILSCLPIADAVKTSVLSRKWRYRWASIPHLVFERDLKLLDHNELIANDDKVVDIVNGVLSVHKGPVHKFVCSGHYVPVVERRHHLDEWMLFLSKHGIKQLTLGPFMDGLWYIMHSCLFSCQELTDLDLTNCEIHPPPAFEGFCHLRNLKLYEVVIKDVELEQLISKCPLLETLTMVNIRVAIHFKINALNLRYLSFTIEAYDDEYFEQRGICNLINVFVSLPHLEKLILHCDSLRFLSQGNVPDVLPTPFLPLKNLSMEVSFMDLKEVVTIFCMLRSSPNLEKLEILIQNWRREPYSTPLAVFWEAQEHMSCLLNHLRTVKISGIMGKACELCFIKFLLVNAPVLETMSIDMKKKIAMVKELRFLRGVLQFRRASSQAIVRCDW